MSTAQVSLNALGEELGRALRKHRSALMQESRLQVAIGQCLTDMKVPHEAEHRLTPQSRLDFFLGDGVCIEVKKGNAGLPELRQIGRYLEHPNVTGCILICMKVHRLIPKIFLNKPITTIELWRMLL